MLPPADQVVESLMTLLRVLGIVAMLPAGPTSLGMFRIRAALAIVLTALIAANTTGEVPLDDHVALVAIHELGLGICFGFGIRVLFVAAQVVAELLLHSSGLAQVAYQQAMGGNQVQGITRFFELTLITVFFASSGHQVLIGNLLQAIVEVPIGHFQITEIGLSMAVGFLARSFELGVYTSFPLLASAGTAMVVTGVIHRLIPQLASLVSSAGIGYLFLLATMLLGMGAISGMFESGIHAYADGFTTRALLEGLD